MMPAGRQRSILAGDFDLPGHSGFIQGDLSG
jgi:hypothetical protein